MGGREPFCLVRQAQSSAKHNPTRGLTLFLAEPRPSGMTRIGARSVIFTISVSVARPLRNDPATGGIGLDHGSKKESFYGPKSECASA
jgi:hypothetical protein